MKNKIIIIILILTVGSIYLVVKNKKGGRITPVCEIYHPNLLMNEQEIIVEKILLQTNL